MGCSMSETLSSKQAAEYLGTSPDRVRRLARQGRLPGVKLGHTWRFRKADLEETFSEAVANQALVDEAERILSDPSTEWVPWEQVKAAPGV